MAQPEPFKIHRAEREIYIGRLLIAVGLMLLLSAVLIVRFFNLQILEYDNYRVQSDRNRVHLQPISPTRGLVFDRNGVLLADNRPSYILTVTRERVADMDASLSLLQALLQIEVEDIDKFRRRLSAARPFEQVPIKFRLSPEDIAVLAVNRYRMPGFEVKAELARYYPQGPYFAHAVGYVGRINEKELKRLDPVNYAGTHVIGKTGVERYYEDSLHGTVGYENVETNARGRVLRVVDRTDPLPGRDLILNIDARVQKVAYDALQGERGAVVALDPDDGGVIAFVSTPGFDPNLFVGGISSVDYRALNDSPDLPLYNRATMGQYPPASTIKPIIGLAGLEYEVVTPFTAINDPGWYRLPNDRRNYRDWKKWGHGRRINLHTAIEQSCDVYYYHLAYKLGVDQIYAFGSLFGLGKVSGVDLPVERSGILPSRDWKREHRSEPWYPGETLNIGIARGIGAGLQYRIAGKTGTAQVIGIAQDAEYDAELIAKSHRDHALFIAFAPVASPRIAVAVIVENGEHGSSTAAPIARKVMDAYLLGVPGEPEEQPEEISLVQP